MKRICIIPAKGFSRRLTAKNSRPFFGRPIIAYSIDTALKSNLFDEIIVSTDCAEIAQIARDRRVAIHVRPPDHDPEMGTQELAAVVTRNWCRKGESPRQICVIYPCAPLINASDLKRGLDLMLDAHGLFAYAVHAVTFKDAGAFYWSDGYALTNGFALDGPHTVFVPLPDSRVCDVNTAVDWEEMVRKYRGLHPELNHA